MSVRECARIGPCKQTPLGNIGRKISNTMLELGVGDVARLTAGVSAKILGPKGQQSIVNELLTIGVNMITCTDLQYENELPHCAAHLLHGIF